MIISFLKKLLKKLLNLPLKKEPKYKWHINLGRCPNINITKQSIIVKFSDGSIGYSHPPTNYTWFPLTAKYSIYYYCIVNIPYITCNDVNRLIKSKQI